MIISAYFMYKYVICVLIIMIILQLLNLFDILWEANIFVPYTKIIEFYKYMNEYFGN